MERLTGAPCYTKSDNKVPFLTLVGAGGAVGSAAATGVAATAGWAAAAGDPGTGHRRRRVRRVRASVWPAPPVRPRPVERRRVTPPQTGGRTVPATARRQRRHRQLTAQFVEFRGQPCGGVGVGDPGQPGAGVVDQRPGLVELPGRQGRAGAVDRLLDVADLGLLRVQHLGQRPQRVRWPRVLAADRQAEPGHQDDGRRHRRGPAPGPPRPPGPVRASPPAPGGHAGLGSATGRLGSPPARRRWGWTGQPGPGPRARRSASRPARRRPVARRHWRARRGAGRRRRSPRGRPPDHRRRAGARSFMPPPRPDCRPAYGDGPGPGTGPPGPPAADMPRVAPTSSADRPTATRRTMISRWSSERCRSRPASRRAWSVATACCSGPGARRRPGREDRPPGSPPGAAHRGPLGVRHLVRRDAVHEGRERAALVAEIGQGAQNGEADLLGDVVGGRVPAAGAAEMGAAVPHDVGPDEFEQGRRRLRVARAPRVPPAPALARSSPRPPPTLPCVRTVTVTGRRSPAGYAICHSGGDSFLGCNTRGPACR